MKKGLILLIIFILQYSILNSQDTWVQSYAPFGSGDDENYTVRNIAICQDGCYAVNGTYQYWNPPYTLEFGFLMKTDSDGNFLWAKKDTVSFIERTESYAFAETDDEGFISATTNSTIGGGNALIKRDSEGSREWVVNNGEFQVWSMAKTSDGNIVLSGFLSLNLPAIRKITQDGTELWTQTYNPNNNRETGRISSIIETSDGGLAATGYIQGNGLDIFILKTDTDGDTLWTRTYDGYGDNDYGRCIIKRNNNNFVIIGYFYSFRFFETIIFQFNNIGSIISIDTLSSNFSSSSIIETSDDHFIGYYWEDSRSLCKYNESGEIVWVNELPMYSLAGGDRGLTKTVEGGFLCVGTNYGNSNIKIVKTDSTGQYTGVIDDNILKLKDFNLHTYPNPFNPITTISYEIYYPANISLKIYNTKGQLVKILIDDEYTLIGKHQLTWNGLNNKGKPVCSGVYYVQLQNERLFDIKKVLLIK